MKYKFQQKHRFQLAKKKRAKGRLISLIQKMVALVFLILDLIIIIPTEFYNSPEMAIRSYFQNVNLVVTSIEVEGNEKVSSEEIVKLSKAKVGDNIVMIDLSDIKKGVETNKWIAEATVERVLPDAIKIIVEEERAKAVYIQNQKMYLVNDSGKIIEEISDYSLYKNYIYLIGEGANVGYSEMLDYLYSSESIYSKIEGLIKIGNRRWDVKLNNNITLKLPESSLTENLVIFDEIIQKYNLLYYPCIIDLRLLPAKLYVKF
jgi:cell division protein FtsQ